jgi:hypothetical protein
MEEEMSVKVTRLTIRLLLMVPFLLTGSLARENDAGSQDNTADIVAIDQLWNAYAHKLDAGNAQGVADLFIQGGGYVLLYTNRQTQKLEPMGYSPTTTGNGTSGIPGGGCKALGHNAIVNFLTNIGLGNNHPRAPLDHHIITSKWIEVRSNTATMKAYWMIVTGRDPAKGRMTPSMKDSGQYDNSFVRTPEGWKVDRDRVIFDSNISTYPCRN